MLVLTVVEKKGAVDELLVRAQGGRPDQVQRHVRAPGHHRLLALKPE